MKPMQKELITGSVGTALGVAGTAAQTNEILQTVSLVLTIMGALVSFVIVPLLNWYSNAKRDGKITKEEANEGLATLKKGLQDLDDLKGANKHDEGKN